MSARPCNHASSGCDYPAGECGGACGVQARCDCEAPGHIKAGGICMDCGCNVGHNASPIGDGGPAFPHDDRARQFERTGMTLRDYFAAKTLPACIAVAAEALAAGRVTMSDEQAADLRRAICIDAWGWADEMFATRGTQS